MTARRVATVLLSTLLLGAGLGAPRAAAEPPYDDVPGEYPLMAWLAADGRGELDRDWDDYDIVETLLIDAFADFASPVNFLVDPGISVTAFLPTDRAFRRFVGRLTGRWPHTEAATLRRLLRRVDRTTLDRAVLPTHLSLGTLSRRSLRTLVGASIDNVNNEPLAIRSRRHRLWVVDQDPSTPAAKLLFAERDLSGGNRQVGHGINQVLLPPPGPLS